MTHHPTNKADGLPCAGASDTGLVRRNNEDCFVSRPDLGLWVVCDGIGGHEGGELASRVAADTVVRQAGQGKDLTAALHAAHLEVRAAWAAVGRQEAREPGTTAVVLKLSGGNFEAAWVGDSRLWRWDGVCLHQLSRDHSTVQRLVDQGIITLKDAPHHPESGRLTQAVGIGAQGIKPESLSGQWRPARDAFLLATDGLAFFDEPVRLAALLRTFSGPEEAVAGLIAASLAAGGRDNVTAVVVGWPGRLRSLLGRLVGGLWSRFGLCLLAGLAAFVTLLPAAGLAFEGMPPEKLALITTEAVTALLDKVSSSNPEIREVEIGLFAPRDRKRGGVELKDRAASMEMVNEIFKAVSSEGRPFIVRPPEMLHLFPVRVVVLPHYLDNGGGFANGEISETSYRRAMSFLKNKFVSHDLEVIDPFATRSGRSLPVAAQENQQSGTMICEQYGVELVYSLRLDVKVKNLADGTCQATARLDGEGYDYAGRNLGRQVSKSFTIEAANCEQARVEAEKEIGDEVGRKLDIAKYFAPSDSPGSLSEAGPAASAGGPDTAAGKKWLLQGDYWLEDGQFRLRASLKNPASGVEIFADQVNDGWLSLHRSGLKRIYYGLLALLALTGVGAGFFIRQRLLERAQIAAALQEGLARRDPEAIRPLLPAGARLRVPEKLLATAAALTRPVRGLVLEGGMPGPVCLAPGPEQGLGRSENWIFRVDDPWVSRAPQAWLRSDKGEFFLVHNNKAVNQATVKGEKTVMARLAHGDRIDMGEASSLLVVKPEHNGWLGLDVCKGPSFGCRFVMVTSQADIGPAPDSAVSLPTGESPAALILWREGRPFLSVPPGRSWPLSEYSPPDNSLDAGREAMLADQDTLQFGATVLKIRMGY